MFKLTIIRFKFSSLVLWNMSVVSDIKIAQNM